MKMRFPYLMIVALLVSSVSNGQITIDNATYSTTNLIDGVLVPNGSGTVVSNVTYQGVYNNSGKYQVGYFSTAGNTFTELGFAEGVVLTTGNTSDIPLALGTDPGSVGQMSTGYFSSVPGEIRQSQDYILDLDILAGNENYYNASILEFDFVAAQDFVQFRYVFGSEEYMDDGGFINYQCTSYNDKFGFLISGMGINGGEGYSNDAENIARLANGSEVSINSVNNGVVGSSAVPNGASYCSSENPNWIEGVSTAEYAGTIDGTELNGNTVALTAYKGGLVPGETYHIKLIVTDVYDGAYDAVVYLEAGSFITENPCTPPADPTASVTVQPDCTTPTGTIEVTAPTGANLVYSIGGAYQANTTFTGLVPGDYNVTVQNTSTGCTSGIVTLTVNAVPGAPADPTASVTVQPDCTTPTGTIEVTAPTGANLVYSIGGAYQANTTFTGLVPGDYDVTVQNTSTGCASGIVTLTVNAVPGAPADPTASVTVQPDCTTPTGTIEVTAPTGANLVYSIGGAYQANTTFTGLVPGDYAVTVQNTSTGCTSGIVTLTVNAVPGAPADPTASVTVQPDCTTPTGTIEVTAPTGANLVYSIGGAYQANTTFTGLVPGDYDVTVQNTSTGCTSGIVTLTVDAVPVAETVDIVESGGSIVAGTSYTFTAIGNGDLLWSNGEMGASITVSPSVSSTYCVELTDVNGCVDSECRSLIVDLTVTCGEIYIPTAFSPNEDGNNDEFNVIINPDCVQEMNLLVFDRWGEIVFRTNSPTLSWDGKFKGKELDSAVFVYRLDITLIGDDESQKFSGNISLIK